MVSTNFLIHADEAADFLTVVGSPHRLLILLHLRSGEVPVNALVDILQIPQPLLSMHLRKLRGLRLVQTRRDSQRIYYSCNSTKVCALLSILDKFYGEGEAEMRSAAAAAS